MSEKELKFICPKCGSNGFGIRQKEENFTDLSIIGAGIEYGKTEVITVSHQALECADCQKAFIESQGDENPIRDDDILSWIEKNWPQDKE